MTQIPRFCYFLMVILVAAVYLPLGYETLFCRDVEKTHLFYSPVSQDFIYKEKRVGPMPEAAGDAARDHHFAMVYRKADGSYVDRKAFEKHLPFIFYKNMEIWGLLPMTLNNIPFDKKAIKAGRRVMELKSRDIPDHGPNVRLWPLLESNPGQARLVFPEDRFRMADQAMVFVNADTNTEDKGLTRAFTQALREKGFCFPARSVCGKFTVLKPFDNGVFLVDAQYRVFHVKRVDGRPHVVKTPIPARFRTRYIKVSENRDKEHHGLLLAENGRVSLVSWDNYRLIPLPLKGYDPDRMDLKLIFNPLYCTAVYSDDTHIHALAMDRTFTPINAHAHPMSRATLTLAGQVHHFLFPFTLKLGPRENSEFITGRICLGSPLSLLGMAVCTALFTGLARIRGKRRPAPRQILLVAATGIYGLIATSLVDPDQ